MSTTPTPRRRSARLASASKPRLAPLAATLAAVAEDAEPFIAASPSLPRPIAQGPQTSPISSMRHQPSTPSTSVAKPPASEMHPSKIHRPSLLPSSAVKHGFRDLNPTTRTEQLLVAAQATPTKSRDTPSKPTASTHHIMPSSPFTFSVNRPGLDKGLSSEALKVMEGLREEAARIKADLIADRDREQAEHATGDRKYAQPKGKSNRYSAVHMAEFKKMDSIENHPSAFRAAPGRFTPVKAIKRKPSKANLDDASDATTREPGLKRSPSKASLIDEEAAPSTPSKIPGLGGLRAGISNVKRLKQKLEDDAATTRPVSRDTNTSAIPRPTPSAASPSKSHHASSTTFGTPTRSGIARPTDFSSTIRLVKSSSKLDLAAHPEAVVQATPSIVSCPTTGDPTATPSAIPRSSATSTITPSTTGTPGRFEHIKSILKKTTVPKSGSQNSKITGNSEAPGTPSKTPHASRITDKDLTTPSHKLMKHSVNTPRLTTVTPTSHVSPSFKSAMKRVRMVAPGDEYPTMESVLDKAETALEVKYPDLTNFSGLSETDIVIPDADESKPPSVSGTFSFRSDKTIDFGVSKPSFGSSAGQASIRQVRQSVFGGVPGGFPKSQLEGMPDAPTTSPRASKESGGNKENSVPSSVNSDGKYQAISHGIGNKKRNRASADEDDQGRDTPRANKKRRNENGSLEVPATPSRPTGPVPKPFPTSALKVKPKTPSTTRTGAASSTVSARVPGYAAATSAVKNKELLTRKIRQPVRPTDKLKSATAAAAVGATKTASAPPKPTISTGSRTAAQTLSRIAAPTPSRSAAPTPVSRGAATPSRIKTAGATSAATASPARVKPRAAPSISASRLAMLAAPKRR